MRGDMYVTFGLGQREQEVSNVALVTAPISSLR